LTNKIPNHTLPYSINIIVYKLEFQISLGLLPGSGFCFDMIKILHTSDWHIGRSLFGRNRYSEFDAFLEWLAQLIATEKIDVLLVSGDLFDTTTPSNRAQELYYHFLCKVATSSQCHIVITSGNHDSPSFLNAPKALLESLNIHIIGTLPSNPEDEVICLKNDNGKIQAIICAVPYLRDRDIRKVKPDESMADKTQNLISGIQSHYAQVSEVAKEKAKGLKHTPIIGMGHLFTSGGKTIEGDGVRELYVGNLAHVGKDVFPTVLDYVALGHLHLAQVVGKKDTIRYSGSPIPMGFGEAGQEKKVIIVSFDKKIPSVVEQTIPTFQDLKKITGIHPIQVLIFFDLMDNSFNEMFVFNSTNFYPCLFYSRFYLPA